MSFKSIQFKQTQDKDITLWRHAWVSIIGIHMCMLTYALIQTIDEATPIPRCLSLLFVWSLWTIKLEKVITAKMNQLFCIPRIYTEEAFRASITANSNAPRDASTYTCIASPSFAITCISGIVLCSILVSITLIFDAPVPSIINSRQLLQYAYAYALDSDSASAVNTTASTLAIYLYALMVMHSTVQSVYVCLVAKCENVSCVC